jgi:hypothetical protein
VQHVNLLRNGIEERQAELNGPFGKPWRRLLGTDDTGIVKVTRFLRQRPRARPPAMGKNWMFI